MTEDLVYLFEGTVNKWHSEEIVEKVHIMAYNLFQATHIFMNYLYGDDDTNDNPYNQPVEMGEVKRVYTVNKIINPEFILSELMDEDNFDPDIPFEVLKENKDMETMTFKHSCGEQITCANFNWPFINCPSCKRRIERKDIEDVGGIFVYTNLENKDD